MSGRPLRLIVYDRTCTGPLARPRRQDGRRPEILRLIGLSTAWSRGTWLYRTLGRADAAFGAAGWDEALGWLAGVEPSRPIGEIQFWGHGKWGCALIAREPLDAGALAPGHRLRPRLDAVRERLVPGGEALFWLRTCESFGAAAGLDFAARLADGLGARVAGHTHVIAVLQSGLHGLRPGRVPDWPAAEGLAEGTPEAPVRAHGSGRARPNTITCFDGAVPPAWFA